jgi:plastocyanin
MEIVRVHSRSLFPVAALLGAAVVVLPTVASSETPSISAYDEPGLYGAHSWMPATATVGSGGVVKFANPYGETDHGLKFTGGPTTPSCTGIPAAASEPAGATEWQGECTFSTPGTYTFICTVHPGEMKGTITVNPNGTTMTTMTTPTTATTTPTTAPTIAPPGGPGSGTASDSPLAGSVAQAIKLAPGQHGKSVHGSVAVSQAGAGGRLEVELFTSAASLTRAKHPSRVRVGRLLRSSLKAGAVSFAVPLIAKASSALRRHRRLALAVEIVLTPVIGAPVRTTRSVVEHA